MANEECKISEFRVWDAGGGDCWTVTKEHGSIGDCCNVAKVKGVFTTGCDDEYRVHVMVLDQTDTIVASSYVTPGGNSFESIPTDLECNWTKLWFFEHKSSGAVTWTVDEIVKLECKGDEC